MASLTPIYLWRRGGYGGRQVLFLVKDANQNDTVTVSELEAIVDTVALNANSHAEVTCSQTGNIVTISGTLTATDLLILVGGH